MLLQHNIDRTDAEYNTKAPFRYQCPLTLLSGTLPAQAIRSVVVYCDENIVPPVRITSLSVDPEAAECCGVLFSDAEGHAVGTAYLYKLEQGVFITTFILDQYDVIKGHVSYNTDATNAFLQAAIMSGGLLRMTDDDFLLLPQCHVASFKGHLRAIRVNGKLTHRHVNFNPTIEMRSEAVTAESNTGLAPYSYVVSLAEPLEQGETMDTSLSLNGITWLAMNNLFKVDGVAAQSPTYLLQHPFDIAGAHLVIRSSDTSNIRVISTERAITFTGVLDV